LIAPSTSWSSTMNTGSSSPSESNSTAESILSSAQAAYDIYGGTHVKVLECEQFNLFFLTPHILKN
jgi:hypothetical protein